MTLDQLTKRVIEEANIVEIINEVVTLKPKGNSMFGVCPFHPDKNPSMSVSESKKIFNCFSCGTKGNVISFVSKYDGISYSQATIKLAKKLGIPLSDNIINEADNLNHLYKIMDEANEFYKFYLKNSTDASKAMTYLTNRGIDEQIIDKFGIGLAPGAEADLNITLNKLNYDLISQNELGLITVSQDGKARDVFHNRIIFPITDQSGRPVGFSGRIYLPNDSKEAKYVNTKETKIFSKGHILYNFYNASKVARIEDSFYVFEGFMDVIAAEKAGITNGVATMGTAFTINHLRSLLSITKNIILCFDGDTAGINALMKTIQIFSNQNIIPDALILPDGLDPDEYLNKYGKEALFKELKGQKKNAIDVIYDYSLKRLNLNDINSLENFKNSVFSVLALIAQQTVKDHFIKKLSKDLQISEENIISDFKKYQENSYRERQFKPKLENIQKATIENTQIKTKDLKALEGIIIAVLRNKDYFIRLLELFPSRDIMEFYTSLDKKYLLYKDVILKIYQYYYGDISVSPDALVPPVLITKIFPLQTIDQGYLLCDKLINDKVRYDNFNLAALEGDLKTLKELLHAKETADLAVIAGNTGTDESLRQYCDQMIKIKKIKKTK